LGWGLWLSQDCSYSQGPIAKLFNRLSVNYPLHIPVSLVFADGMDGQDVPIVPRFARFY
jgi:hypothetical protein